MRKGSLMFAVRKSIFCHPFRVVGDWIRFPGGVGGPQPPANIWQPSGLRCESGTSNCVKGGPPKSKGMKKTVSIRLSQFVNSRLIVNLHIAAAGTAALRHFGNTPSRYALLVLAGVLAVPCLRAAETSKSDMEFFREQNQAYPGR